MGLVGTYIIAEAGVNHNGSLEMAKELIDVAASAGVDAVKFQTFHTDALVCMDAPKAHYQKQTTSIKESQYEMLKKLELNKEMHQILIQYCKERNVQFLSTPFDIESVELLTAYSLPYLKISSGEITNAPLLLKIASSNRKIILSTGMCTLGEIEQALGVLAYGFLHPDSFPKQGDFEAAFISSNGQRILSEKVILLHCTTEYPTPFSEVNLNVIDTLKQAFGLPVGLSDHTLGISIPIAAVAKGAVVIEKHFTLDRTLPGPDHQASLEPKALKQMVESIREVEMAFGLSRKHATISEQKNKSASRKSLVAKKEIHSDELFTEENLTVKRPGTGISPYKYWDYIGRKSDRSYHKDELIK